MTRSAAVRTTAPPAQLMTAREAADYLHITLNSLYIRVSQGQIPHRRVGNLLRFDPAELEEWTRSRH